MPLVVPARQLELVSIGDVRAYFVTRENGSSRLVIEGLRPNDVVRVAGIDVQLKPAKSDARTKIHATGPREIPVRATGILANPEAEQEEEQRLRTKYEPGDQSGPSEPRIGGGR